MSAGRRRPSADLPLPLRTLHRREFLEVEEESKRSRLRPAVDKRIADGSLGLLSDDTIPGP